jgi:hypothetical protein
VKNKNKKSINQQKAGRASFKGINFIGHSGLKKVATFLNRQNVVKSISGIFPVQWYNNTKFCSTSVF